MTPEEGQEVSLITPGWHTEPQRGRLLAVTGSAGHVKWESGPRTGSITMEAVDDLLGVGPALPVATAATDLWSDSLEGSAEGFSVEGAIADDVWLFGEAGDPYGDDR